ncbi:MAG: cytochrome c-type biogenesis protein CcmH [Rhodospirillales bacterium]|nr:cytochrome c-type biogenesis protein CcmH [Rhodospirillales bacterium]
MTTGRLSALAGLVLILASAWSFPTYAVNPDEVLSDPVLEARAREISKGLRCLVCQNQSIDDSDAGLAKDLRVLVRERLVSGDSNDAVVEFVVARYGDFVLLKPPFNISTIALWLGPAAIAGGGLIAVFVFFRRRRIIVAGGPQSTPPPEPLSDDEKRRLDKILGGDEA